jgi:hypothetical protein
MFYGRGVLNLTTMASRAFPPASMLDPLNGEVITPNGDAFGFFAQADAVHADIYQDHAGTLTKLGTVQAVMGYPMGPVTDGTSLVFNGVVPNTGNTIQLFTNGAAQTLGQPATRPFAPPLDYQISSGWVAYRQPSSGVYQVWSRSPSGDAKPLSYFLNDSAIDAIGPTGEVMFTNGSSRYLRLLPAAPAVINSSLGKAGAQCDGWYVRIGASLFKVSNTEDAGTGCPPLDAGAPLGTPPDAQAGMTVDGASPDATLAVDSSAMSSNPDGAATQNDALAPAQDDAGAAAASASDATSGDSAMDDAANSGAAASGGGGIYSRPGGCEVGVLGPRRSTGKPWGLGAGVLAILLAGRRRHAAGMAFRTRGQAGRLRSASG